MRGIRAAAIGESLDLAAHRGEGAPARARDEPSPASAETIRSELSDREIEVLKLIANGKDNAMIAARAAHQPEDGQEPHLEHPDEAPDPEPDPGGRLRGPQRDRLDAAASTRPARGRVPQQQGLEHGAQPVELVVVAESRRRARPARPPSLRVTLDRGDHGDPALDAIRSSSSSSARA
jgi:hypothetical protein